MKITSLEEFFTVYNPDYINTIICSSNRTQAFRDEFGMPDPDNFWMWREWIRLWTEDYTKIPVNALNVNQLTVDYPDTRFHFLHVAKSSPGLIAYTESPEHGKQDRQIIMKLGKYLSRYAPNYDPRPIVAEYIRILTPPELKFARTREEIRRVYDEGPQSCMKLKRIGAWGPNNNYAEIISPVEVYAGPDTSVAYIGDYNIHEGVKARTVINERNKTWIRLYGDDYQLKDLLRNAGFSFGGNLCGCRVLYFRQDEYGDRPVMPYLDGDCNQCYVYDDTYIEITEDGDWKCNEQNGTVNPSDPECTCDYCGNVCDEEDTHYIESTDQQVCNHCLNNNFTHAYTGRYAEYVCDDDTDTYEYNGQYYTEDGLEYHSLYLFEGEVYSADEVCNDDIDDEIIPLDRAIHITDGFSDKLTRVDNISVHVLDNIYFDFDEMKIWYDVEYEDAIANDLTSLDELLSAHPEIDHVWDVLAFNPYGYNTHLFRKAIINAISSQVRQLENEHRVFTSDYLRRINPSRIVEELRPVTRSNILSDAYALAA